MKCVLLVFCSVLLNAHAHAFDAYGKYDDVASLEEVLFSDKDMTDKQPYINQTDIDEYGLSCKDSPEDYYWRDYKGIIPKDALPVDENTYIGQVYVYNKGVYVGPLTPGVTEIEVSAYGVRRQKYLIKILCTKHKDCFDWVNTTSTTFHEDIKDKFPVVGGYDYFNHGELLIGRQIDGETLNLGVLNAFEPEEVYLWYPKENQDVKALNYEVLVYGSS